MAVSLKKSDNSFGTKSVSVTGTKPIREYTPVHLIDEENTLPRDDVTTVDSSNLAKCAPVTTDASDASVKKEQQGSCRLDSLREYGYMSRGMSMHTFKKIASLLLAIAGIVLCLYGLRFILSELVFIMSADKLDMSREMSQFVKAALIAVAAAVSSRVAAGLSEFI